MGIRFKFVAKILFLCLKTIKKKVSEIHILIFLSLIRYVSDNVESKELYTGTPNSDIRILCTVHCGRNVNKPSAPQKLEGMDVILQSNKKQVNISS